MTTKETMLKEELAETKKQLETIKSLVAESFEIKALRFRLTLDQNIRLIEVEQKLKELCLPKKLITTSTLLKKEN